MHTNTEPTPCIPNPLPPFNPDLDVDQTGYNNNGDRADRGHHVVDGYADSPQGVDDGDIYGDVICDVLHAAHRKGFDVQEILNMGVANFLTETTGEGV